MANEAAEKVSHMPIMPIIDGNGKSKDLHHLKADVKNWNCRP